MTEFTTTNSADIICDSIGPNGVRLTTFVVSFPRFVLPEFNTHRAFSRNGASSRAIPVAKQLEKVRQQPFIPAAFNKNTKGMQGGDVVEQATQEQAELLWLGARNACLEAADKLQALGIAKQYVNRLLEPFTFTTMVVTATDFSNFFALRHHNMAQPEIADLAKKMWDQYSTNRPKELKANEWHLPFITESQKEEQALNCLADRSTLTQEDVWQRYWLPLIKMSVARCARVSYMKHDGVASTYAEDCALYDRLLASQPIHASPAEHQAMAQADRPELYSGNLRGYIQYRKLLPNENITHFEGPLE